MVSGLIDRPRPLELVSDHVYLNNTVGLSASQNEGKEKKLYFPPIADNRHHPAYHTAHYPKVHQCHSREGGGMSPQSWKFLKTF